MKSVSQFIAIQNSECIATRQNCIANCDAIPLISNADNTATSFSILWKNIPVKFGAYRLKTAEKIWPEKKQIYRKKYDITEIFENCLLTKTARIKKSQCNPILTKL